MFSAIVLFCMFIFVYQEIITSKMYEFCIHIYYIIVYQCIPDQNLIL